MNIFFLILENINDTGMGGKIIRLIHPLIRCSCFEALPKLCRNQKCGKTEFDTELDIIVQESNLLNSGNFNQGCAVTVMIVYIASLEK